MKPSIRLLCCLIPLFGAHAAAQTPTPCPELPEDAGLHWEHQGGADFDYCRAMSEDGRQLFGVMLRREEPPRLSGASREEAGVIDGREVRWYRTEIAQNPDMQTRVTQVELADGRYAEIWIRADSQERLRHALQLAEGLSFR